MNVPWLMFVLILLVGPVSIWAGISFNKELKENCPSQWEALGCPETFRLSSLREQLKLVTFMMFRRYTNLNNRRLSVLGDISLLCTVILAVIFLYWIVQFNRPLSFRFHIGLETTKVISLCSVCKNAELCHRTTHS